MPFRTNAGELLPIEAPPRTAPPRLLAFAAFGDHYRAIYLSHGVIRIVGIDRRNGGAALERVLPLACETPLTMAFRDHWGVAQRTNTRRVEIVADEQDGEVRIDLDPGDVLAPVIVDGRACLAMSAEGISSTHERGPGIAVRSGATGNDVLDGRWFAPPTARHMLAATSTVFGPAAVYSTDRADEIDVCASGREGAALQRTVSLGRKQAFECAVGGGTRIMVVSRDDDGLVARTLASDVRSELNPVPIRPRTGWAIGAVSVVHANGPFVVGHTEIRDESTVGVLTVFDAGETHSHRLSLPGVDVLAADGKDVCAAVMIASASSPVLLVHRASRTGTGSRHYAFFLEEPDTRTAIARHAVLLDIADIVSRAFGAKTTIDFKLRTFDELGDAADFCVPGIDRANDIAATVLLREDGSGVTSLRYGGGVAPEPRALAFTTRMRVMLTGDDDGDPSTTRVEHECVSRSIETIIAAIGALRAVREI